MILRISPNPDQLARDVADWLLRYEQEVLQKQDRFCIALSGGSTPRALFQLLAQAPYRDQLSWHKWHVFWGDERGVPLSDERNNARMAYDALLDHVPIPANQIHVMRTDLEPKISMNAYAQTLHEYFNGTNFTFDLVLLGMGDDGHTLSLFPGRDWVQEQTAWTRAYFLVQQEMNRMTLMPSVVNRAAAVAFLVAGEKKATVLHEVLYGDYQPDKYPSQVIKPKGQLFWFVDQAASGQL